MVYLATSSCMLPLTDPGQSPIPASLSSISTHPKGGSTRESPACWHQVRKGHTVSRDKNRTYQSACRIRIIQLHITCSMWPVNEHYKQKLHTHQTYKFRSKSELPWLGDPLRVALGPFFIQFVWSIIVVSCQNSEIMMNVDSSNVPIKKASRKPRLVSEGYENTYIAPNDPIPHSDV